MTILEHRHEFRPSTNERAIEVYQIGPRSLGHISPAFLAIEGECQMGGCTAVRAARVDASSHAGVYLDANQFEWEDRRIRKVRVPLDATVVEIAPFVDGG
jgi:hypothetical protein